MTQTSHILPTDLASFWAENDLCLAESQPYTFSTRKPRCAVTFSPDDHWLFELLPVESPRYYFDKPYRDGIHRRANTITLEGVGKAFFSEETWETSPKRIENLFGSEFAYTEGGTPWLQHVTEDPDEFAHILDTAEATDIADWALPADYRSEWERRASNGASLPFMGTGSRGPATIMTSVINPQVLFLWMYDHPDLVARFRDVLARKMVELNRVLRAFSGYDAHSWWITDDNSALFNRKLYRTYCVPVLQAVLNEFAPLPCTRYQHSDSSMGHLLEEQHSLGINSVNYGPEVDAGLIRQKMPEAVIHGQLPPFLLRNGTYEEVQQRVRADFEKAGVNGGLIIATAGSLAAGTTIERMRWLMECVIENCRYAQEKE